jgi:putative colanic acid biosynthesis UDP-glucose lipid carrier transferase
LVSWSVSTWIVLIISRVIARNTLGWMREKGLNIRNIVLVGNNKLSEEIASKLQKEIWAGFNLKGVFIKDYDPEDTVVGHPVLGGINYISEYVEENNIDQVWIVMPLKEEEAVMRVINELKLSTVDIRYVPDIFGLNLFNHSITEVIGYPIINLSVSPMVGMNKFVKVIEDRFLALIIFIAFLPIMLLIGVIVKLTSKGLILFKQKRHGWDGRIINVYKFRTMHLHAEKGGNVTQAISEDHRITNFGKFLRRASLDELPQLYNVLQGRMSLVGPRPHAIEHNLDYREKIDQYMLRHKVKPGITGWAQVNGFRGETNTIDKMKKRIEYDILRIGLYG